MTQLRKSFVGCKVPKKGMGAQTQTVLEKLFLFPSYLFM